jgi:putative DNA primase/helicase
MAQPEDNIPQASPDRQDASTLDPSLIAELLSHRHLYMVDSFEFAKLLRQGGFPTTFLDTDAYLTKRLLGSGKSIIVIQWPGPEGAAFGLRVKAELEALKWKGELTLASLPDPFFDWTILERETAGDRHRLAVFIADVAACGVPYTLGTGKRVVGKGPAASNGSRQGTGHEHTPAQETPLSDQYNAEALVQVHGADLHYCERWNSWLIWDGTRWAIDEEGQVMRWAKDAVKQLAARVGDIQGEAEIIAFLKHMQRSLSRHSLEAMVTLAQSEVGIPVMPEAFDRDPWLFNVQNGTIDLRTAELRPHRREDLLMKLSPVAYDAAAECPQWEQFLGEIYAEDQDLIAFDQKATGYTLTGDTRERVLLICHGSGTNGKSTMLSLMRELMGEGEYALRTNLKAFTESTAHHQPASIEYYIAKLQHVRFAYAAEGEEGARLAEALIKDVTGGVDFITGRHPYGQPFSFRPRFKLWLGTNHEPVIRGTDPAIWRRTRKIPFTVSFEGREDPQLFDKLRQELPGILRWAVKGCLRWQQEGLQPPQAVQDATAAYRRAMDVVGRFLEECCTLATHAKVESTMLYKAYVKWCEDNGETALSQRKLAERLLERGLRNDTKDSVTRRVHWAGIGLVDA